MIAQELDQLLWDEADGELTAEDRVRLDAFLADHPEALRRRRELADLSDLLAEVGEVDPPPMLRHRIRRATAAAAEARRERSAVVTPLRRVFTRGPVVRWGYLAAGLLLGAAGYHLVSGQLDRSQPVDVSRLYGALSSLHPAPGAGVEVGLGGVDGNLRLHREGALVVADLRLAHHGEVQIAFEHAGGLSVRRVGQSGAASSRVRVEGNRVVVELGADGRLSSTLEIAPEAESPLVVTVMVEGNVVSQETVFVNEIPEVS